MLLLFAKTSKSQVFPIQQFTEEDGLVNSNVYRIFQDSRSYLWFGTENGISRFDGNKFFNYTSTDKVILNGVMGFNELDSCKKIAWTYQGCAYLIDNDSIYPFGVKGKYDLSTIIFTLNDHEKIWIIDKKGRLLLYANQTICEIKPSGIAKPIYFRKMAKSHSGIVYFASDNGIYIFKDNVLQPYLTKGISDGAYALTFDEDDNIWVGTGNKIVKVTKNLTIRDYFIGRVSEISDLICDSKGRIWAAIPKLGILVLNNEKFENITTELKLQGILVNTLFADKNGNIWIASHGSGLFCVLGIDLINYPVEHGKINNYVNAITFNKGSIYVGSIGTISQFNGNDLTTLKLKNLRPTDFIYFLEMNNNKLYIGTPRGIIIKNLRNKQGEKFINNNGAISCFFEKNGDMIIGKYSGTDILKYGGTQTRDYSDIFINNRVNCITSKKNGNLLFGTNSGLIICEHGKYRNILLDRNVVEEKVNAILVDPQGRLWIGTDHGAYVLDNDKINHYSIKQGLCGNKCTSFACDSFGNIWIGTLNGLNKFDGNQFSKIDAKSGLCSNSVLSLFFYGQNLWVGTINGLSMLALKKTNTDVNPPPVYITQARFEGKNYFFPESVVLSPDDKSIHISFAGIEFPRSDKLEYQYKIVPGSDNWRSISGNDIELSSLAAGEYQFLLRARHTGFEWNKRPQSLKITVLSPIWSKSWFIALASLVLIFFIYRILKWWILRKENEKRHTAYLNNKMVYLKQQALTAMINPHFVFNCLNSIQSYIYTNDKDKANNFLVKFSRLIRMTLEHGQDAFISLNKELERLDLYLSIEQLRFINKLSFDLIVNKNLITEKILIPNMILQPYIENAIKHGIVPKKEGGKVEINIEQQTDGGLKVTIMDNGVGFSNSTGGSGHNGRSLGMKLTAERLGLLSKMYGNVYSVKTIENKNENGSVTGTTVELYISTDVKAEEFEIGEKAIPFP